MLHCPYCHGHEVADRPIGVLATGPLAVHQALMWRQWSDDVTLFLHTGPEPSAEEYEELAARDVAVVDGEVAGLEIADDRFTGVRLTSGRVVPREALVVQARFTARSAVLESLGLTPVAQEMAGTVVGTYIPSDPTGATEVPGVWVVKQRHAPHRAGGRRGRRGAHGGGGAQRRSDHGGHPTGGGGPPRMRGGECGGAVRPGRRGARRAVRRAELRGGAKARTA